MLLSTIPPSGRSLLDDYGFFSCHVKGRRVVGRIIYIRLLNRTGRAYGVVKSFDNEKFPQFLFPFTFSQIDSSRQLAKNLYLSTSRSPIRQFKELIMTWMLETPLSKKRILELYLDII